MRKKLNIILRFFVSTILTISLFNYSGSIFAATPSDYLQLDNLCSYYTERLDSQQRTMQTDLQYVQSVLSRLSGYKDKLTEKAAKLRNAAARCRERLNRNELDACTVTFKGSEISILQAEETAKKYDGLISKCSTCQNEAMQDEKALSLRLREINTLKADFAAWKNDNDDAVKEAMLSVLEYLFGAFGDWMAKQANAASAFKGWITRYEKQLTQDGVNVPEVLAKIEATYSKLAAAQATAGVGKLLKATDPTTLWTLFTNTTSQVALLEAECDSQVKEVLADKRIEKYLNDDRPMLEVVDVLSQKGFEELLTSRKLNKIIGLSKYAPAVGISILVRDAGYSVTKWWLSLKQLTQRYDLAEQSGKAVESLHKLIEKRKSSWQECLGVL